MRKFAFINDAAEKEYKSLPAAIQDEFGKDLRRIQFEQKPQLPMKHLNSIGVGVIELKINGSPAWRCVYVAKYRDLVVVLHTFIKTTNGVDRPAMALVEKRLKELLVEIQGTKTGQ